MILRYSIVVFRFACLSPRSRGCWHGIVRYEIQQIKHNFPLLITFLIIEMMSTMLKTKVKPRGAVGILASWHRGIVASWHRGIVASWLPVITRVGLLSLSWPEDLKESLSWLIGNFVACGTAFGMLLDGWLAHPPNLHPVLVLPVEESPRANIRHLAGNSLHGKRYLFCIMSLERPFSSTLSSLNMYAWFY